MKTGEKSNVIRFPNITAAKEFLEEFEKRYDAGEITDAILMFRFKEKGEKEATTQHTWFGESSSLFCLGMAQMLVYIISKYIYGYERQEKE